MTFLVAVQDGKRKPRSLTFSPKTCQHGPQNLPKGGQDPSKSRPRPSKIEAKTVSDGFERQHHFPNRSLGASGKGCGRHSFDFGACFWVVSCTNIILYKQRQCSHVLVVLHTYLLYNFIFWKTTAFETKVVGELHFECALIQHQC